MLRRWDKWVGFVRQYYSRFWPSLEYKMYLDQSAYRCRWQTFLQLLSSAQTDFLLTPLVIYNRWLSLVRITLLNLMLSRWVSGFITRQNYYRFWLNLEYGMYAVQSACLCRSKISLQFLASVLGNLFLTPVVLSHI